MCASLQSLFQSLHKPLAWELRQPAIRRSHISRGVSKMGKPVILITGALTGIGRATALAFARRGGNLVVAGRHDAGGKALSEELRSLGSEAEFINADVRYEDDVRVLANQTV